MVADGIMGFVVIWKLWNWRAASAAALIVPFRRRRHDFFFSANLLKLLEGAWVPPAVRDRHGGHDLDLAPRFGNPDRPRPRRIEVPLNDLIKKPRKSDRRTSSRAPRFS